MQNGRTNVTQLIVSKLVHSGLATLTSTLIGMLNLNEKWLYYIQIDEMPIYRKTDD